MWEWEPVKGQIFTGFCWTLGLRSQRFVLGLKGPCLDSYFIILHVISQPPRFFFQARKSFLISVHFVSISNSSKTITTNRSNTKLYK